MTWVRGLNWDDTNPTDNEKTWTELRSDLTAILEISIPPSLLKGNSSQRLVKKIMLQLSIQSLGLSRSHLNGFTILEDKNCTRQNNLPTAIRAVWGRISFKYCYYYDQESLSESSWYQPSCVDRFHNCSTVDSATAKNVANVCSQQSSTNSETEQSFCSCFCMCEHQGGSSGIGFNSYEGRFPFNSSLLVAD